MNRVAFEVWGRILGLMPVDLETEPDGSYATGIVDACWTAWSARDAEVAALKARVEELSAWEESWRRQSEELKALVAELEADAKGPVYDDQLPRFKRTHWTQGEEGEW